MLRIRKQPAPLLTSAAPRCSARTGPRSSRRSWGRFRRRCDPASRPRGRVGDGPVTPDATADVPALSSGCASSESAPNRGVFHEQDCTSKAKPGGRMARLDTPWRTRTCDLRRPSCTRGAGRAAFPADRGRSEAADALSRYPAGKVLAQLLTEPSPTCMGRRVETEGIQGPVRAPVLTVSVIERDAAICAQSGGSTSAFGLGGRPSGGEEGTGAVRSLKIMSVARPVARRSGEADHPGPDRALSAAKTLARTAAAAPGT